MFKCRTNNRAAYLLVLVAALSLLSGCGKSRDVVTQDDSADYRSAISLPPLKKPSRTTNNNSADTADDKVTIIAPKVVAEPSAATVVAPQLGLNAVAPESSIQAPSEVKQEKSSDSISSKVVDGEAGTAQLVINAGFEEAWNYLSGNMQRSNITVHNRNQSAGAIAIGCADMDQTATVASPGRWSIFKRQPQKSEHCGLRLIANSKQTIVQVLSRSGAEVLADDARSLFARLLNN